MSLTETTVQGRHITSSGHIILILSQLVFALSPLCSVLSGEARNTNFIVFGLTWLGLEPLIYHTRCEHHRVGWICLDYKSWMPLHFKHQWIFELYCGALLKFRFCRRNQRKPWIVLTVADNINSYMVALSPLRCACEQDMYKKLVDYTTNYYVIYMPQSFDIYVVFNHKNVCKSYNPIVSTLTFCACLSSNGDVFIIVSVWWGEKSRWWFMTHNLSSVSENSEPSYILDIYYVRSCILAYMYTHL